MSAYRSAAQDAFPPNIWTYQTLLKSQGCCLAGGTHSFCQLAGSKGRLQTQIWLLPLRVSGELNTATVEFVAQACVTATACSILLQESAKYAHSLFQNTVNLYGRSMRVDYSPQGNPEAKSTAHNIAETDAPRAAPLGAVSAAGGGFILKRKNRNIDPSMSMPAPVTQPQDDA